MTSVTDLQKIGAFLKQNRAYAAEPETTRIDDIGIALRVFEEDPRFSAAFEDQGAQNDNVSTIVEMFCADHDLDSLKSEKDGVLAIDPATIVIGGAVLLLLQCEVTFDRSSDGKWSLRLKKRAMPAKSLIELVRYFRDMSAAE